MFFDNSEDPHEIAQNVSFHRGLNCLLCKINSGFVCLFLLILYIEVNNFSVMSGRVSWVEPVFSRG